MSILDIQTGQDTQTSVVNHMYIHVHTTKEQVITNLSCVVMYNACQAHSNKDSTAFTNV